MILNVLCSRAVCGGRTIFHPLSVAMLKSPRLKGSAMLALLGTLSRIWCSWQRLRQVQCDPIRLLSGWCLPVPLRMVCLEALLSQSWIYGVVRSGRNRTGAMTAVHASRK